MGKLSKAHRAQKEDRRKESRKEFARSAGGQVNADNAKFVKEAVNYCLNLPHVGRKGLMLGLKDELGYEFPSKRITQIASGCFPACPEREAPALIKFARREGFDLGAA